MRAVKYLLKVAGSDLRGLVGCLGPTASAAEHWHCPACEGRLVRQAEYTARV